MAVVIPEHLDRKETVLGMFDFDFFLVVFESFLFHGARGSYPDTATDLRISCGRVPCPSVILACTLTTGR